MEFKKEQSISEVGLPTRVNEDEVYTSQSCAFVIDGASSVTKMNVTGGDDVAWYVKELKKNLVSLVNLDISIFEIIKRALKETNEAFSKFLGSENLDVYPSACLSLVRIRGDKLEYYSIGDSQLIIKFKDGRVKTVFKDEVEKIEQVYIQKAVRIARERGIDVLDARPFVSEDIRAQKNLMNKEGGYYILSQDVDGVDHGLYGELPLDEVESVLGCTDGFSEIYYSFKHYTIKEIFAQLRGGKKLQELSDELKTLQEEDNKCNRVPRLKKRDDTTAYYLEIC